MDTTSNEQVQADMAYNHRVFEEYVGKMKDIIEAQGPRQGQLAAEWAEVEELAADIAEDLGLMHTHPVAVLTVLHDRARGQRAA